jgi:hypothetical protein
MNTRDRLKIVNKIRRRMEEWFAHQRTVSRIGQHCLWWAYFTCQVLNEQGFRAVLQAGTCYWPRLLAEQDDGLESTHTQFGYLYTPGLCNYGIIADGRLPEMHVWAGLPDINTIVDLTTGYFPEQAKILAEIDWPGAQPPSYFWGRIAEMPDGCVYAPVHEAIKVAWAVINSALAKEPIIIVPLED